ncbi:hypothetical protein CR152_29680 [Massilia violaceinigra]|uniref:Uncharacterized protein n=1 Tax=Massilia violaceinigra TaxID=2045208 RepID=A0A2D2DTC6_9BURK|nr:hypothetical protein CR152_29680 [Massilia violaceinigra]
MGGDNPAARPPARALAKGEVQAPWPPVLLHVTKTNFRKVGNVSPDAVRMRLFSRTSFMVFLMVFILRLGKNQM